MTLRLTFWPRLHVSRNYLSNQAEKKDIGLLIMSFCTDFDAVLVVIVISPGDAIFARFYIK